MTTRTKALLRLIPLCMIALSGASNSSLAAERPNVLWIFSEDLSPFMGCYDDPINAGHTPVIDQIAANGVLFKRAFVPAPVCSACRSAVITGVMQTTTGTHQHRSSRTDDGQVVPEETQIHLPEGMKTIPELMREAGYFTFNSGKDDYNFHYDRRKLYDVGTAPDYQPGMNGWQGNKAQYALSITKDTWNSRENKDQPWFGQIEIKGGKANANHVRKGERLADNDVPLPPYFPNTPGHRKSWTMHYNAARGADARVEAILEQLKADGELDKTIVFFFSDHGSNHSVRHKQFCYEGGVHIPLMVMGEHSALKAGTIRNELVSALDIPATTLAMAGAELPEYLDGQDLFAEDYEPVEYVISARDRCDYTIDRIRTVRSEHLRYIRNYYPNRPMLQAQYRDDNVEVRDLKRLHEAGELTDYQEQHWFGVRPAEELYDIDADPHQIDNLVTKPEYRDELRRHREILEAWIKKTNDRGQYPEAVAQLKATFDLWKDKPIFKDADVNPEYDQFRSKSRQQPNVIYILADDLGYGDLGCYGQTRFETSHIDALARRGMRFTQHYAGSTVCAPSRSALLTGQHTGHTPVRGNAEVKPEGQVPMPADTFTVGHLMQQAGYKTGVFGKWGLGAPGSVSEPLKMGFDRFYGYNCQRIAHCYYPAFLWNDHERELLWGNVASKKDDYAPDFIHAEVLDFIRKNNDQPFFCYYAAVQPHADMVAPEKYMKKYRGKYLPEVDYPEDYYAAQPEGHAAFVAMVNVLDDYVGEVMAELDNLGIADNTLVVFASDNGPHLEGGHDPEFFDSNGSFKGFKRDLYEGGIRVPMIAVWPGKIEASAESDHVSAFWDILPTMAELVGKPLTADIDGVSMLPTLLGKPEQQQHEFLYWEFPAVQGRIAIRKGDWKAVRYNVFKAPTAPLELYDLSQDPSETNNVAAQHPELVGELEALIKKAHTDSPNPRFHFPPATQAGN